MLKKNLFLLVLASCSFVSAAQADVSLRNFREIIAGYEAITGVSSRDTEIQAIYRGVVDRLPVNGRVEELSSPMILGLTELSGTFCSKFIDQEASVTPGLRRIFKYVDFAQGPDQFDDTDKDQIIKDYSLAFWQREALSQEAVILRGVFEDAVKDEGAAAAATTGSLKVLCAVFATSLEFLEK